MVEDEFRDVRKCARFESFKIVDFKKNTATGVFYALKCLSNYCNDFHRSGYLTFQSLYEKAMEYRVNFDLDENKIEFPTLKSDEDHETVIPTISAYDFVKAFNLFRSDSKILKSVGKDEFNLTEPKDQIELFISFITVVLNFLMLNL